MDRLFSGLAWDVLGARRELLRGGERRTYAAGETLVVSVEGGPIDIPRGAQECATTPGGMVVREAHRIEDGGVLLSLGRHPLVLRAEESAALHLTRLRPTAASTGRLGPVPDVLTVAAFAEIEPAAAALAPHVGLIDPPVEQCVGETLCRLMGTTLALGVLRAWAAVGCAPAGWPSRSSDPHLARVLEAIHDDPGGEWTLDRLAGAAMMSRSAFAERFRADTGRAPLAYVAEVRMAEARSLLADGTPVSEAARILGYGSDEGFSRAFRRHTGMAPSAWRAAGDADRMVAVA